MSIGKQYIHTTDRSLFQPADSHNRISIEPDGSDTLMTFTMQCGILPDPVQKVNISGWQMNAKSWKLYSDNPLIHYANSIQMFRKVSLLLCHLRCVLIALLKQRIIYEYLIWSPTPLE